MDKPLGCMKGTFHYTIPIRSRNVSYVRHKGLLERIDHHETVQGEMETKGSGNTYFEDITKAASAYSSNPIEV